MSRSLHVPIEELLPLPDTDDPAYEGTERWSIPGTGVTVLAWMTDSCSTASLGPHPAGSTLWGWSVEDPSPLSLLEHTDGGYWPENGLEPGRERAIELGARAGMQRVAGHISMAYHRRLASASLR